MSLAHQEDVASVLATWINDAANLPAELAYLFDELAAQDKLFLEHTSVLEARDASLQKYIRQNGSLVAHPKEQQYAEQIRASYEKALQVQAEKMKLAEKALELVGRYEKRLVGKMKGLYKDGLLAEDPSPPPATTVVVGGQQAGGGTATPARQRTNSVAGTNLPLATPVIQAAINTPGAAGPTDKALKRRVTLNTATPAARDSTPTASILPPPPRKPSEDPVPSQSRAGSVSARGTPAPPGKLKRSLSNAPPSRKGTLGSRKRLKKPPTHHPDGEASGSIILGDGTGAHTVEEEDDGADDRKYCFCKQVSYGDMVGCDNDSCRYEWFHWGCVGIEKEPIGKWYCEECRVTLGK